MPRNFTTLPPLHSVPGTVTRYTNGKWKIAKAPSPTTSLTQTRPQKTRPRKNVTQSVTDARDEGRKRPRSFHQLIDYTGAE